MGSPTEDSENDDVANGHDRVSEVPAARTPREWLAVAPLPKVPSLALGLVLPTILLIVNMVRVRAFTVDDAYISYRFARNLARGLGLVYNPGERVEGYTNFLWTV